MQALDGSTPAIVVTIVDSCGSCDFAHIDLEQQAYLAVSGGSLIAGKVTVAWEFIDCPSGQTAEVFSAITSDQYIPDQGIGAER